MYQNNKIIRSRFLCVKVDSGFALSTFFSTFDRDLANIHRYFWKERLKISKPAELESDMLKMSEGVALQSRKILHF